MFIEERHQEIYQIIKEKGRVEVQELSAIFNVSGDSIRRDLRIMEQKGLLERTYGGAVLQNKVSYSPPFSDRIKLNTRSKEDIALLASSFLQDNDTIFLDGSTTVAKLIPYLNNHKNITVITNSIIIAHEIASSSSQISLIMIGGTIQKNTANALGIDTVQAIEKLYVDKVFIAPCAASAQTGLSSSSIEEAPVKKAILEAGREIFVLIDSVKFGKRSLCNFSEIKLNYTIITDEDITDSIYQEFKQLIDNGLKIVYQKTKKID